MASEALPPGELLNDGEPTRPRTASTVLVLRGGAQRLEVLMVQRNPAARFMAGAWVFPGGAVDPHEGEGDAANRRAAVREVEEETGIRLPDPQALVPVSRWITPPELRIRFDTYFFLAEMPDGQEVRIDDAECVAYEWVTPAAALADFRAGRRTLVLPTVRHLELLAGLGSAEEALASLRDGEVELVEPRIVGDGGAGARVIVPDAPPHSAPGASGV